MEHEKNKPATKKEIAEIRSLLDDYLLRDLAGMLAATKPAGLGFPMLQTLVGGIELLGALLSGGSGEGAFGKFYTELAKTNPAYKPARRFFRDAVRNKTAHLYLLHTNITVGKDGTGHLTRTAPGRVHLDLVTMHDDFVRTYERVMDELEAGTREAYGVDRVKASLSKEEQLVRDLAAKLPEYPATPGAGSDVSTSGTGFSGTPGPSDSSSPAWSSVSDKPWQVKIYAASATTFSPSGADGLDSQKAHDVGEQ